ncbi:CHRD domain-containing protein [Streptomyces sp. NPDC047315]|uniref:CHRD domain-containing protein n=1 Tax=Streptomyces sp. NPDC047315 TaxID=3155142 RepID=UPI0033D51CB4
MRRVLVAAQVVLLTASVAGCAGLDGTSRAPAAGAKPQAAAARGSSPAATEEGTSLIARLDGGRGARVVALLRISGDRVTFSLTWSGTGPPRSAGVRAGGDQAVAGLFGNGLPAGARSVAGRMTVTDPAQAERLRTRPGEFTVDLGPGESTGDGSVPAGGVLRGPLTESGQPVDPLGVIPDGALRALADGRQESGGEGAPKGDKDAHTTVSLDPGKGGALNYSLAWVNLEPPTAAQVHRGALGQSGEVAVPLFTTPLPRTLIAVSGTVEVTDPATLRDLAAKPGGFYVTLNTADFPRGAVRGQVFR